MELENKSILSKRTAKDGDGDGRHGNASGLGVLTASVFLTGQLAGAGVMGLPYALEQTGYIGIVLILVCCIVTCYTGYILGECWLIVQSRYEEHRGHVRHPYPTIAYVAFGEPGRFIQSCCSNLTIVGVEIILIILSSQNIHSLLRNMFDVDVKFCLIMVISVALVTPLTWFGTPKDFWVIAVGAALSTAIAVFLALAVTIKDGLQQPSLSKTEHSPIDAIHFFEGVGTIIFATAGHYGLLTLQNDMKHPSKFVYSVVLTYTGLAVLYMPIALAGYLVYGKHVTTNILLSLSPGPVSYVILILVTCHQFCATVVILNPLLQHLEEFFSSPKSFTWRRVVIRSSMTMFLLFVAETVPRFGPIMSLVGGSTNMAIMMIGPPIFYAKLCSMTGDWPEIHLPLHIKIVFVELVAIGILIGVMSTYGSVQTLWGSAALTLPCYVNTTVEGG